ncbi:tyrosine-type recombinase/integrase [Raoultella ornithinolytica]|uniref:tyrosine-type recombinase/integrase n=1 Tax=Raoultella ornithinolytica TaxID=54291 RepID=UPI00096A269D|nr:integrase arm-type DNA-binding domain-containing protein [Raoultella ornithinolytica]
MSSKPLTHTEVKNAKPQKKDYSLYDGFGLLLYVSSAGGKSWRFRYSHPLTGKRQTLTIGRYPEFSLAEAREERDKARRLVARGVDPVEVRREEKALKQKEHGETFSVLAAAWLAKKESDGLRERSLIYTRKGIDHLNSIIGGISVHKITASHTLAELEKFSKHPALRLKLCSYANGVMDFAVNAGIIAYNPLLRIAKALPTVKVTPLPAFSPALFPEFLNIWGASICGEPTKQALIFQILTMTRPAESYGARWEEIDTDNALWNIPAERMKAKRPHTVTLSRQAMDILETMKAWRRGDYVFPSLRRQNEAISRYNVTKIISRSKFKGLIVPHGFRSLASTVLNEEGFNPDIIEAALAHKSGDAIRNIYNRSTYIEKRRILLQWWGDYVEAAGKGEILETKGDKGLRLVG